MAQKVRPDILRLGIIGNWRSRWFNRGDFKKWLEEDYVIREVIAKRINSAGISKVEIERTSDQCRISITAARPGLVIGRGGKGIEELTAALQKALLKVRRDQNRGDEKIRLSLNVEELKRSDISAVNVAQNIAWDLEKRMRFRRVIKKYIETVEQNREVQGVKIRVAGRLDGADIARAEWLTRGKLPLQTLRADIDYGTATASTTYGAVGIKVWIYKGEVFEDKNKKQASDHATRS